MRWWLSIVCGGFPFPLPDPLTMWLLLEYSVPHTGEKLSQTVLLALRYTVITNRLFIKNPTNFIHLTLAQGFLAKAGNQMVLIFRTAATQFGLFWYGLQSFGWSRLVWYGLEGST